ncbi:hypothetical protein [Chitinophaga sancti]|uniref:Uncharacterized protein n=1 Tax=Chitinophaga sancti TaxID=1004 RepID=A0A1K1SX15_9BACT|nr:hypothetical protein [Chitinophaga sancti]WQD62262.1 hypothetical protein U0033_30690 [Chitinophaga sancti]WQG92169.1 hypothetical protein SR876_11695 [Chitinophaga sancti]SFW88897.1 hypothetical protein SAMN05661012_06327 [Chitinophaga sancti]
MTPFHKPLLIILVVFSGLLAGCSKKNLSASLYDSHLESHRSFNWKSRVIRTTYLNGQTIGANSCVGGSTLKDVPLTVNYMNDTTGSEGNGICRAVKISIDSIQHGIMWTPIFKHFSFQSNVPVNFERFFFLPSGDSTQVVWYQIKGLVEVTGKMSINGFCSYSEARRLMVKCILDNVYASVRNEMDTEK